MAKHTANTVIITDPQAEGSPDRREIDEPRAPSVAPANVNLRRSAPIAETGLVTAVTLHGEGEDNSETQDATRTTSEIQSVPTAQTQTLPRAQRAPSALIIEDSSELAEILQVTLRRMHIDTAHESHGLRAFERFNEMLPDVVLLDIGLPDITGWKVLDTIKERQRETGGKMPIVIVMTAYGDPANRLVGKLHGVHSYLIKPFTPAEIERVVSSALNSAAG